VADFDASQVLTIPQSLDLCGSIADLTFFTELLNLNFAIIGQLSEDLLGIAINIPGIPPVSVPDTAIDLTTYQPGLDVAWIGGRYPIGFREFSQAVKTKLPGIKLPGVDPLEYVLQQASYNFQVILEALASTLDLAIVLPGFTSPCLPDLPAAIGGQYPVVTDAPVGASAASMTSSINSLFNQIIAVIVDAGDACPDLFGDGFTEPDWTETPGGPNGSSVSDATSWTVTTAGGGFATWTNERDADSDTWGGCQTLHITVQLTAAITDHPEGEATASINFSVNDASICLAVWTAAIGQETKTCSITIPAPTSVHILIEAFMGGLSVEGFTRAEILDFSLSE